MADESRCSFCAKEAGGVRKMVAGPPGIFICDECVDVCSEVVKPDRPKPPQTASMDEAIRIADLRIRMFAALKGWGATGDDGKWRAWNGPELREITDQYVFGWAMNTLVPTGPESTGNG